MTTVATLTTEMRLNSAAFRRGMVEAANTANRSLKSIQVQAKQTASVLLSLKRAASAFGSFYLLKEGIQNLIQTQVTLQQIHYTLLQATGSSEKADEAFRYLSDTSQQLGTNFKESAVGFGRLASAAVANGVSIAQTEKLYTAFSKAQVVMHLNSDQSARAILALTEMMDRGVIQTRQLQRQLGFAVPGAASRFKNAVLEAVKGTDLAGKSFDKLLKDGDLVTAKFLPQLTEALDKSGTGFKEAATGLNAQLNRLGKAWFDVKSEVSGGLFNDAATQGARLLADNLHAVANAAILVGSVGLGRLVGGGLSRGASSVKQSYQEQVTGAQMAAAAERDYAKAQLASAMAEQERLAERAHLMRSSAAGQEAAYQSAQAARAEAAAQVDAARATLEHQATAATLSANIRAQTVAEANLAKATEAYAAAEKRRDAALAGRIRLTEEAQVAEAQLMRAEEAHAVAARAVAVAEREVASATLISRVNALAASFKDFAFGLVGGPWGAAVLAIGALGYAFYRVNKASEEYRAETKKQVQALQDLAANARATAEAYGTIGDKTSAKDVAHQFEQATLDINKQREAVAALKKEIASEQAGLRNASTFGYNFSTQGLQDMKQRLAGLQANLSEAQRDAAELGAQLARRLTPAVEQFGKTVSNANGPMAIFNAGLKLWKDAGKALTDTSGLDAQMKAAEELSALRVSMQKKLKTEGKTNVQIVREYLDEEISAIKSRRLSMDKEAALIKATRDKVLGKGGAMQYAKQLDALKAAKKNETAARVMDNAYSMLEKRLKENIKSNDQIISGYTKLSPAQKLQIDLNYELQHQLKNLDGKRRTNLETLAKQALADEKVAKAKKDKLAEMEAEAILTRQLTAMAKQQKDAINTAVAGVGHGTLRNQQEQQLNQITKQYDQMRKEADRAYAADVRNHVDAKVAEDKHATALGKITSAETQAKLRAVQGFRSLAAARDDWFNGARAGWEDYLSTAADVASQTHDLVTNAFKGMEDAIVNFATTGKLSFRSLAVSILQDLVRIETRILISKVLTSILSSFGGGTYAGVSGGASAGGVAGIMGPPRAAGGMVGAGSIQQVAENGRPELLNSGNKTYLLMGNRGGEVTPASSGAASLGGSGVSNFHYSSTVVIQSNGQASTKTSGDQSNQLGKAIDKRLRAMTREEVARMMRPGGEIWLYNHGVRA